MGVRGYTGKNSSPTLKRDKARKEFIKSGILRLTN
jgi:hypothetical protein